MATQENQLAVTGTVQRRVEMSKSLLERMGMTVEQYERVALNALVVNPGLADCDPKSLDVAVMHCIQAGLLPDGKQAAIVPYNGKATLVPMIEGRLQLGRRATPGMSLRVRLVYQEDDWEYEEGLHPVLKHKVNPTGNRTDQQIIAAYAVATFPYGGGTDFEVHQRGDIDRYRGYSRSKSGPWQTHYGEMAKKAVLGQLLKRLPKAVGAPPEPPAYFEGAEIEDDLSGVIDAEQGSYTVDNQEPVQSTRGPLETDMVNTETGEVTSNAPPNDSHLRDVTQAVQRPRRQRAQQPASEPEPPPWVDDTNAQAAMQEPATGDESPF